MVEKVKTAVMTIAGSDSCGGAGIQADLKTLHALGVHGASAVTAVTAQNTDGVRSIQPVADEIITGQMEAIIDDLPIAAIKTGMLPGPDSIEAVCEVLECRCAGIPVVVDPVLVATSGSALTVGDTVEALKTRLLPLAALVTPNLEEALALSDGRHDPLEAAARILATGCGAVLIKDGHGSDSMVRDRLVTTKSTREFAHPRQKGEFHGTGCTLSAAIAAYLAKGINLDDAVERSIDFLEGSMSAARLPLRGKLLLLGID